MINLEDNVVKKAILCAFFFESLVIGILSFFLSKYPLHLMLFSIVMQPLVVFLSLEIGKKISFKKTISLSILSILLCFILIKTSMSLKTRAHRLHPSSGKMPNSKQIQDINRPVDSKIEIPKTFNKSAPEISKEENKGASRDAEETDDSNKSERESADENEALSGVLVESEERNSDETERVAKKINQASMAKQDLGKLLSAIHRKDCIEINSLVKSISSVIEIPNDIQDKITNVGCPQ